MTERYKAAVTTYAASERWADWEVLDTEESSLFDEIASGIAPDKTTAYQCAEAVIAALREAQADGDAARRASDDTKPDLIWKPTGVWLVWDKSIATLRLGDRTELVVCQVLPGRAPGGEPWFAQRYSLYEPSGIRKDVLEAERHSDPQTALDNLANRLCKQHAALSKALGRWSVSDGK